MDLGWRIALTIGGGIALYQFLFQEVEPIYKIQLIIILALVILWWFIDDTRKNYTKKRGRKNVD